MKKFINTMSVLILMFVIIILMLSSCSAGRGMTNCDYAQKRMIGYR